MSVKLSQQLKTCWKFVYFHYGFDNIIKCGWIGVNKMLITEKRLLYEIKLINVRKEYNVSKKTFIFLFYTY